MEFDFNKAIQYFQAVVTDHYADFNGRVSRKDFWTYVAVFVVISLGVALLQNIIGVALLSLLHLALFLPNAGMTARRLQDTGKNGSLVWILMVPLLISSLVSFLVSITFGAFGLILFFLPLMGLILMFAVVAAVYMIYLCLQPGTLGSNQFGPEPASVT